MRERLLTRSSGEALWTAAFVECHTLGIKRPSTLSIVRFAALLFESHCQSCCATHARPEILWLFRTRLCAKCIATECGTQAQLLKPSADCRLRHVVPSISSYRAVFDSKTTNTSRLIVLRADVRAASRKLGSMDDDEWRQRFESMLTARRQAQTELGLCAREAPRCACPHFGR